MSTQQLSECPICLDNIEELSNKVITECGHIFHCSCLMKNVSHNGFKCPCCRSKMADESDDESVDESEEEIIEFDENVLTSFRMFHQQINGEELEQEELEVEVEEVEVEEVEIPDANYVSQKLIERGITFEDLVKNTLYQEHSTSDQYLDAYELRSAEVYGQFRAVITQFTRRPPPRLIPIPISTILSSYSIPSSNASPSIPLNPPLPLNPPYPFNTRILIMEDSDNEL